MTSNERELTAPLLRLPLEIRTQMYEMLLESAYTIPLSTQGVRTKSSRVVRSPGDYWSKQSIFAEPPNTGLLRVNRKLHGETVAFMYRTNKFAFKDLLTLRRFLETIGPGGPHITGFILEGDALMGRSISSAMHRLKLCENLVVLGVSHPSLCAAKTDATVGAIASGFVKALEPLLDVLAKKFVENNLAKSIANLVQIDPLRCTRCRFGFSSRCWHGQPCRCSCQQGLNKSWAMENTVGKLIAERYGVQYWPNIEWWQFNEGGGKAWASKERHMARLEEEEETEKLKSLSVLFQDIGLPCSCSSPLCRGGV